MTDTTALVEELARAIKHAFCLSIGAHPDDEWRLYIPEATATLPIIAREVAKARAEGFAAGMEFDPDEATGCADDALPGTAEQWKAAIRAGNGGEG